MHITPLHNPLINNSQEINNPNVDSSWANQIRSITPKRCVRITANVLISAGSLSGYLCLSDCYPLNYIYVALYGSSIYIANRLITRIYQSDSSENQDTRTPTQMIMGNHGSFRSRLKPKSRKLNISYTELTELPSNYHYNDSDTCNITLEPLEQGDTVCCDTYLYSFKVLKQYYEKYNGKIIPHNRQPLDWNKVYKLSTYGVTPTS